MIAALHIISLLSAKVFLPSSLYPWDNIEKWVSQVNFPIDNKKSQTELLNIWKVRERPFDIYGGEGGQKIWPKISLPPIFCREKN